MRAEMDALFRELQSKAAVNYHLGGVMEGLMDFHPAFQRGGQPGRSATRAFIRSSKPRLHAAMDHLNRFAMVIGNLEMFYQHLLDHPGLDLESKVRLQDAATAHVINLKRLHGKQKQALTTITQIFLKLSKQHIREVKRERK